MYQLIQIIRVLKIDKILPHCMEKSTKMKAQAVFACCSQSVNAFSLTAFRETGKFFLIQFFVAALIVSLFPRSSGVARAFPALC